MNQDEQISEVHLQPTPDAPSTARGFVRDLIDGTEFQKISSDAQLVTSELVSNVTQHASGQILLRVVVESQRLSIAVTDQTAESPIVNMAPDSQGGYGLHVVKALASRWGVEFETTRPGKTVWAEFQL